MQNFSEARRVMAVKPMIECSECSKEVLVDEVVYCDYCGVPLCSECGTVGLCSTCEETWQAEEDLEMEEEETD